MNEIKQVAMDAIPITHRQDHEGYEYYKRKFVPYGAARNTQVVVYEIPPEKRPIRTIITIRTKKPSIS